MDPVNDPLVLNDVPSDEEQMSDFYRKVLQINDDNLILGLMTQGLNTMAGYNQLTADEIVKICSNIRRPGGMIEDDDGHQQPNRGLQVTIGGAALEAILVLLCLLLYDPVDPRFW
jgi:hypothetical protein